MSTIKVDTIATRTGSGNITLSNNVASLTSAGAISGTNLTASGTLAVTGETTLTGGAKVNTLKHTGGTTGMTIDSSGRVKTPNVINFMVNGQGGDWKDHGSSATVYFKTSNQACTVHTNVGSCFDKSTGRFTVPTGMDGLYQFNCHLYTNHTGDTNHYATIYKNGSSWKDSFFLYQSNDTAYPDNSLSFTWCMPLVATDYITIVVREDIYGPHSYWNGYFVG